MSVDSFAKDGTRNKDVAPAPNQHIQVHRDSQRSPSHNYRPAIIPCAQIISDTAETTKHVVIAKLQEGIKDYDNDSPIDRDGLVQMALTEMRMWVPGTPLTVSFMNCQDIPPPVIAAVKKHAKR
ncbi:hypothetical protein QCA50_011606 [Cerrena zonata]|uniref:Uncharacterized protein n=1 Tax=Cerrena zonata TaxID=2478898 RepID=A0AAW0FVZ0_9APHY